MAVSGFRAMVKEQPIMESKKKILAISYLFPNVNQPNHGIFVLNRLKAMSRYVDVTVINPIPDSLFHRRLAQYNHLASIPAVEQIDGLTVYHPRFFSIPGHLKSIEVFSYYLAVKNVVETLEQSFDLIDLHWTFPDLPTGYFLSRKLQCPFHVTLRGMEAFHQQDAGLRKHIVAHYLKKADHVISLSEEMAIKADELAHTATKTTVIRNGVDTDKFYYLEQQHCREQLGLPLNEKIILGVGSLIYRKGFDVVIKALAQLNLIFKQDEKPVFYILGSQGPEGDYRQELTHLILQHQLEQHVKLVGAVSNEQLIMWYNAADVFCLSSRGEGSPNVLTEALACGTPAVATNVGSVPEIMASEPNLGWCVETDNVNQLAEALTQALTYPVNRFENAQQFKKYNWDWCAKQVIALY
jgi:glycosyltransferase involved in cell wall biosynthesis